MTLLHTRVEEHSRAAGAARREQHRRHQSRAQRIRRHRTWVAVADTAVVCSASGGAVLTATPAHGMAENLTLTALLAVIWLWLLGRSGSRGRAALASPTHEARRVLRATGFAFASFASGVVLLGVGGGMRNFVLGVLAFGVPLLVGERALLRSVRGRLVGSSGAQCIILGSRSDAEYVAARIQDEPGVGFEVVGVAVQGMATGHALTVGGQTLPVLCQPQEVAQVAHARQVDSVIVAGDVRGGREFVQQLAWSLEESAIEFVAATPLAHVSSRRLHVASVDGLPLARLADRHSRRLRRSAKRCLDVCVAVPALLCALPVIAVLAILVKAEDRGPCFFRQVRVGRGGREFRMAKLRSMAVDAEARLTELTVHNEGAGPLFKMARDPRVTRIGVLLRKFSLDELPQLWNVLRGDMSLVGPRPALPREVAEYEPTAHRRLLVKPGITGLWQVSGRSDLSWERGVRLDLWYVDNWSIAVDAAILLRTVQTVLRPNGAY
ncbi:sugar transferase [Streptomyces sp. TRM66268-LWL]|uniref:Sugar transferase n=1 Tax=Streptomyces polyasparticus TaxID=2767826 RepID=A0ABR7SZ33_9ACTN|nr:sugar transferase [Streptomyces polyasparticus]MBC9719528.1 sugar transferase [Streptomyces polyasparticus]